MVRSSRKPRLPAAPEDTASGYVRLSEAAQAENLSRDGMVADVERKAAELGLRLIGPVHVDDGLSGAVRNRPEFVAWLDDARECRAANLIAWHVDRMTREGVNVAALILDAIEGKDPETGRVIREPARLVDTKGLDSAGDETAFRFRFLIAAEVARAERERMRDRTRAMHARARAAGRWTHGRPPFGFRAVDNPDGAGKVLEVVAVEAEIVRDVAAWAVAGDGLALCARRLNARGVQTRTGREWSRGTISQLLTGDAVRSLILSPAENRAVRELLDRPANPRHGRTHSRLLSGIIVCGTCGRTLKVAARNGAPIYRCNAREAGYTCGRGVSAPAGPCDDYVERFFLDGWGRLPYLERRVVVAGADELALAEDAKAAALQTLGEAPTQEAFAALQAAQARVEALAALPVETVERSVPTGRTYAEEWAQSTLEDRRRMLLDYAESVVLGAGRRGNRRFDAAVAEERLEIRPRADVEDYDAE